jgi:hypothetical protein
MAAVVGGQFPPGRGLYNATAREVARVHEVVGSGCGQGLCRRRAVMRRGRSAKGVLAATRSQLEGSDSDERETEE